MKIKRKIVGYKDLKTYHKVRPIIGVALAIVFFPIVALVLLSQLLNKIAEFLGGCFNNVAGWLAAYVTYIINRMWRNNPKDSVLAQPKEKENGN